MTTQEKDKRILEVHRQQMEVIEKAIKKPKQYMCYIKSHCEAPDFEWEVEANSKREAAEKIMCGEAAAMGWDTDSLMEHISEI